MRHTVDQFVTYRYDLRSDQRAADSTDYDAAVFGSELPAEAKARVNQERAYSSPIWYQPAR